MESASSVTDMPKENGSSESVKTGNDAMVAEDKTIPDALESVGGDASKSVSLRGGEQNIDELADDAEIPVLDEFATDEMIAESVVVASVNGDQVTLVQGHVSSDDVDLSLENSAPVLEFTGGNGIADIKESKVEGSADVTEAMDVAENEPEVETRDEETAGRSVPEETEKTEAEVESVQPESDTEQAKAQEKKTSEKDGSTQEASSRKSEGNSGRESSKGRFAVQADLNINSRPKRSVPRRSVFEMLQGEIRSPGPSKRSSTDAGSESDQEPGPSKRHVSKKSKSTASDKLETISESSRSRDEKPQVSTNKKGKSHQVKGKGQGKDVENGGRESARKKSSELMLDAEEHGDTFVADDFDLVETVVGVDGQNAPRAATAGDDDEDEEDGLTLAKIRSETLRRSTDEGASSDNHSVHCEDPAVEDPGDSDQLEYNSRWHSYATPRKPGSPSNVKESLHTHNDSEDQADDAVRHAESFSTSPDFERDDRSKLDEHDRRQKEVSASPVDADKRRGSSTPWYMTTAANEDGFLGDTKALQNRIDELTKINEELKLRLKEVESKTATKKFNIDFHSRKFSKAREPVFGSPADRKLVVERKSIGKVGAAAVASERGAGGASSEKDLSERGQALERREEKLRALDVELDERTASLKANEGKLLRTERRLKEMEKTLEYREKALRKMELNADKTGTEVKSSDVSGDADAPTEQGTGVNMEVDTGKLERRQQELERLWRFLNEEREKLLPKQQRLTKWEAKLRKQEDELERREHRLSNVSISRKGRALQSDGDDDDAESESDEDDKPLRTPVGKTTTMAGNRRVHSEKNKKMSSSQIFKRTSKFSSPISASRKKKAASCKMETPPSVISGRKRSADGKPVKEYKLRKRC